MYATAQRGNLFEKSYKTAFVLEGGLGDNNLARFTKRP